MTLDLHIFKQWMGTFLGIILIATGVLLLGRVLKLLAIFSDKGIEWAIMLTMIQAILPYFLVLTIPIAFFLSVQALILKLQKESEMDAMRAAGLSYTRILRPIWISATMLWMLLTYATLQWVPQGQLAFQSLLIAVQDLKVAPTFDPQRFSNDLEGFNIYIEGASDDGTLHGFMLEDTRESPSTTYLAKRAELQRIGNTLEFTLHQGTRLSGSLEKQQALQFDRYQVSFDMGGLGLIKLPQWQNRVFEMPILELLSTIKNMPQRLDAVAELHRRLLLPLSIFTLALFALPLSLSGKRSGKSAAYLTGIAILLLLYNAQIVLHQQVAQGALHWSIMWISNALFLLLALYLYHRASQDRLIQFQFPVHLLRKKTAISPPA
ncbi:MAG: LptF/LptG family permease [Zetaproteobacteria bacterium]|nr:LptF/LptG family permease [Zetaproteobacteria bacterium]